jgi:hypothetical protein
MILCVYDSVVSSCGLAALCSPQQAKLPELAGVAPGLLPGKRGRRMTDLSSGRKT